MGTEKTPRLSEGLTVTLPEKILDIERKINLIERDAKNYIGGERAFTSGRDVHLKDAALKKIAALNSKLNCLYDALPDEC
jgi:hypothetical protein